MYKKLCAWLKSDMVANMLIKILWLLSIIQSSSTKRTPTYHLLLQNLMELLLVSSTCIHELRLCMNFFIWQKSSYEQLHMSKYALCLWSYCSMSEYLWRNPFSSRFVAYIGPKRAAISMGVVACECEMYKQSPQWFTHVKRPSFSTTTLFTYIPLYLKQTVMSSLGKSKYSNCNHIWLIHLKPFWCFTHVQRLKQGLKGCHNLANMFKYYHNRFNSLSFRINTINYYTITYFKTEWLAQNSITEIRKRTEQYYSKWSTAVSYLTVPKCWNVNGPLAKLVQKYTFQVVNGLMNPNSATISTQCYSGVSYKCYNVDHLNWSLMVTMPRTPC